MPREGSPPQEGRQRCSCSPLTPSWLLKPSPLVENTQPKGQGGRAHLPPARARLPCPWPTTRQSTIPALPEAPCLGAQSHTETRFLLNMFLISEERQGGRASISCIHGGC